MIFIIIPVFNRKAFTKDCLISLREQTDRNFQVVIVDDGSTDGTEEMLKSEFPEVHVLKGDGNLWWTASVNMGIEFALKNGATSIMTLNNDVIAKEDFIEKMYYWNKQKPDALLGALALDVNTNKIIYGGEVINWKTNTLTNLLKLLPPSKHSGIHKVSHYPGRGLLIPKKVIDKVGFFAQDKFPHYYADYDYTSQAAINGFEVYCNYDASLLTYPDESGDRQNRTKKSFKNYYNHLFGIKGGGNLINFTRFSLRNCPPKYLPYYLINGYLRRIFGYLVK